MKERSTRVRSGVLSLAVLAAGTSSEGAELEIAAYAGKVLPFYEQRIVANLGSGTPIAGVTLRQEQPFELTAKGGLTFAGSVTVWLADPIGIEGRYDSADVDLESIGPVYRMTLAAPLPPASFLLSPGATLLDLQPVTPISLNLRFRTPGPIRIFVSGGLSYLPDLKLNVRQELSVSIAGLPQLGLGAVSLRATARPEEEGSEGRLGVNVGAGLQISLGGGFSLVADGRAFLFKKQVLEWSVGSSASIVPAQAVTALAEQLEPVRFNPAYFHLVGGLALRF